MIHGLKRVIAAAMLAFALAFGYAAVQTQATAPIPVLADPGNGGGTNG